MPKVVAAIPMQKCENLQPKTHKFAPRFCSPTGISRDLSRNTSRPKVLQPYQHRSLQLHSLGASNAENCTQPPCVLRTSIPGRHGPILPTTTTTLQPPKPPILPVHLPGPRLRALHSLASAIRLRPTISPTILPELWRVWGGAQLWRARRQWAHGRARGIEDRLDSCIWDGGL